MYLLTEWEGRTGKYLARGYGVRTERSEVRAPSRHRVGPSYGDFLNSFAMKARAGPYGLYNKTAVWTGMASLTTSEGIKTGQCSKGRWF